MIRLSGTDALFLNMETRYWHQHVGGLSILDTSGAPDFGYEKLVEMLEDRLVYAPKFTWKLKEVPIGLDRPVWVDDPHFDVRRHVRRIGVPEPAGPREIAEIAGEILSYQLDRRRPLWEMWLLEGIPGDRAAMLLKYHHCLLDGVSGASLATVIMDVEPDPPHDRDRPPVPPRSAGQEPSDWGLVARALLPGASTPARMLRYGSQLIGRSIAAAQFARHGGEVPDLTGVPRTSFNAEIGPHRALSFASVSLADVRAIGKHQEVKVNDVVLALCSGALRRYLANRDELPTQSLVSGVPVSTRAEGDTAMDNQIATMQVSLASHIDDPLERLAAIHRSSQSAKEMTDAVRARHIQSIGETAPPLLLNLAIRTAASTHLMNRLPTATNLLVSNVPGPPVPLYAAGAKVIGIYSTSVILEGMGLNITLFSYEDRMDFGLHMDPDLVDDPWELAEGIPMALEELMAAAGLGPPSDVVHPFGDEVMPHSEARAAELAAAAKAKKARPNKARPNKAGPNKAGPKKAGPKKAKQPTTTKKKTKKRATGATTSAAGPAASS